MSGGAGSADRVGRDDMPAPRDPLPRAARLSAAQRRDQLAHVAARRFHELGYHRVSLGDVAAEAGVTGPAVYRHFRNKEALLAAAIVSGLDLVQAAVDEASPGPLEDLVTAVAEVGLARPDMWVLLQRESRFLAPESRAEIQARFAEVIDGFSRRLRRQRPEIRPEDARLLVTAATAVLSLPSTTHTSLTPEEYRHELTSAALACLRTNVASAGAPPAAPDTAARAPEPTSRREQIVDTAVELFFARGYTGVSLDDIGAAVGIAGPSILHHFATKADILVTAFDRASQRLAADQAARRTSGRAPDLVSLVAAYIRFSLENRSLLGVYVSELMHLPPDALARTQDTLRTEVRDWTRALVATSFELEEPAARAHVRAALTVINDLVRLGHFAKRPRIETEILALALATLRG
ncbi:TetR family transcriptional regulator [Pseudonocardia sp. NPDC049154]|uniref:TetR/AcrR family transcriptional regulator n=1 Tax=Pseudonocardia sp. NPDC049154 TaxID=3155501 RepID=UPI0033DD8942